MVVSDQLWSRERVVEEYERLSAEADRADKWALWSVVGGLAGTLAFFGGLGVFHSLYGVPEWIWGTMTVMFMVLFFSGLIGSTYRADSIQGEANKLAPLTLDQAKTVVEWEQEIPEIRPVLAHIRRHRPLIRGDYPFLKERVSEAWVERANRGMNLPKVPQPG